MVMMMTMIGKMMNDCACYLFTMFYVCVSTGNP